VCVCVCVCLCLCVCLNKKAKTGKTGDRGDELFNAVSNAAYQQYVCPNVLFIFQNFYSFFISIFV